MFFGDVAGVVDMMGEFEKTTVDQHLKRGPDGQAAGKRPRKCAAPKPDDPKMKPSSPEEKEMQEATETLDASMESCKSLYDKMSRELSEVKVVEKKLEAKGWGDGPLNFLKTNTFFF